MCKNDLVRPLGWHQSAPLKTSYDKTLHQKVCCSPSTWWTSTRESESESESESEMDSSSDLAAGVNCQSVFVS